MAAEKPCELVRAVTRVLPRDNFARDNFSKGQGAVAGKRCNGS